MSEFDGAGTGADGTDEQAGNEILEFWELARRGVGLGWLGVVVGPSPADSVPPPAWAFGDSAGIADSLLAVVLDGAKTATSSGRWEFEGEESLPREGDLSIILDGRGHPRALVRTTEVRVVPFAEVDAEFARLEGEDDRSLGAWRASHRAYFTRSLADRGEVFVDSVPLVLERFELKFPRIGHHRRDDPESEMGVPNGGIQD